MGLLKSIHALATRGFSSNNGNIFNLSMASEDTGASSSISSLYHRSANYLKQHGRAIKHRLFRTPDHDGRGAKKRELYQRHIATGSGSTKESTNVVSERYITGQLLGEGGNGVVHLCQDTQLGELVAVKTIYHDNSSSPPNEALVLQLVSDHENIVGIHRTMRHPTLNLHTQLVFEYCPIGDLADYSNAMEDGAPETFLWHVFKHVAAGLSHMHQMGIVHGDIKPGNILLAAPRAGELYPLPKIADFGTASIHPPRDIPRGHLATLGFQPPESEYCFGPEADVWALGCVVHELAVKCLPLKRLNTPTMDPTAWYLRTGRQVPSGTAYPSEYQSFCYYMACHAISPVRIDRPNSYASKVYTKLMNYFMLRALDPCRQTRISTHELHKVLPIVEVLVNKLEAKGKGFVLDLFNDGRDREGRKVEVVGDSQVFKQIASMLIMCADRDWDFEMLQWGTGLMQLMKPVDQVGLCWYVAELDLFAS